MSSSVVVITGALSGIGRATAVAFAREGARLVVSGRRDDAGQALVTELRDLGTEAEFVRTDVRQESDVQALIDRTVKRFNRLDIAVNSAGTEGQPGPLTEQSAQSYAATFDTNVLGTILCLKHELRVMAAQRSGSIINLSSTMGSRGAAGASMYVASKHAVEGLTKSAALEGAAYGEDAWIHQLNQCFRIVYKRLGQRILPFRYARFVQLVLTSGKISYPWDTSEAQWLPRQSLARDKSRYRSPCEPNSGCRPGIVWNSSRRMQAFSSNPQQGIFGL